MFCVQGNKINENISQVFPSNVFESKKYFFKLNK